MLFYNAVFLLLIFIRYLLKLSFPQRRLVYYITLFVLFLFSAFRLDVGCDWLNYVNQFNIQSANSLEYALERSEPVWWSIMHYVDELGLPFPWVNVASSFIAFYGIHFLARRQPDPLGFLVLLYPILIINMPMSAIRQGAAIGMICIAFSAFIDKKTIRFVLLTLLASTLHSSAILFMLLAPLVTGDYSKKRLVLAAIIAVPGLLVLIEGGASAEAQHRYIGSGYDAVGSVFRLGLLFLTSLLFFSVLKNKWQKAFSADFKLAVIGSLMMIATLMLFPISSIISDRLGYYLIPLQIMILARIPFLPLTRNRKFYKHASYISLVVVFLVWTSFSRMFSLCYVPYQSWFFDIPDYLSTY